MLQDWLRAGLGVSIQIIAHSNHIGYWRENIITNSKTIITMNIRFYEGRILLEIGNVIHRVMAIYDDKDKYYMTIHEKKITTKLRMEPIFKYLDKIVSCDDYLSIRLIIPKTDIDEGMILL